MLSGKVLVSFAQQEESYFAKINICVPSSTVKLLAIWQQIEFSKGKDDIPDKMAFKMKFTEYFRAIVVQDLEGLKE